MGKTPKHQGRKASRPYNARNVQIHKSVPGNQRLTRSGRKFVSAEYVSRKLSSKYGSQHLRVQNQSYVFGVAHGHKKPASFKLSYLTQAHKSNKKRGLLTKHIRKQTMQEPGNNQSSETVSSTEMKTSINNDPSSEVFTSNENHADNISAELPNTDLIEEVEDEKEENSSGEMVAECALESKDGQTEGNTCQETNETFLVDVESEVSDEESEVTVPEIIEGNESERVTGEESNFNTSTSDVSQDNLHTESRLSDEENYLPEDGDTNLPSGLILEEKNSLVGDTEILTDSDQLEQTSENGHLEATTSQIVTSTESQTSSVENDLRLEQNTDMRVKLESSMGNAVNNSVLSFGGNIRATCGRRPVHRSVSLPNKSSETHVMSSTNIHRDSNIKRNDELVSKDATLMKPLVENVTSGSKRKAEKSDLIVESKKQKVVDISESYGLLSILSSPLQLLRSKVKSNDVNCNSDNPKDKHENGDEKKYGDFSKEKDITSSVRVNKPIYKSCSIM